MSSAEKIHKIPMTPGQQESLTAAIYAHLVGADKLASSRGLKEGVVDLVTRYAEPAVDDDIQIGPDRNPLKVAVSGAQGAGKTLLTGLLSAVDRSTASEAIDFQEGVLALTNYITDYGIKRLTDANDQSVLVRVKPGYDTLFNVLSEALEQAQEGKGNERHNPAGDIPFEEQRMQTISRLIKSVKGMEYQAIKKLTEGLDMPTLDRQERELLGVINYVVGIILFLRGQSAARGNQVIDGFD